MDGNRIDAGMTFYAAFSAGESGLIMMEKDFDQNYSLFCVKPPRHFTAWVNCAEGL